MGTSSDWWQSGVIYQIYPRSYQDSNADGIGDLRGIRARLGYLEELGCDALWISPIFCSPMADFGYDVSNYTDIAPVFGTLDDFDLLVAEVKARGMRLILDYVPNHTSEQHPWFAESRSSRSSDKRDWYLWRDAGAEGGPPNNWLSNFGGTAWEWDAGSKQYYYHSFLKEQPDLNWRNPEVVAAMHEVLRFWFNKGVDGFRIDVLWMLIKDNEWRDNPPNPNYKPGMPVFSSQLPLYTTDRPEVQKIVAGLRSVADEFPERVLIGEIYLPLNRLMAYYGKDLKGVQLPFNFQLLQSAWNARVISALIERYESELPAGGWPNWVLGNHDRSRLASRLGDAQARVAAMMLLTLRGTPTLYYGDELGLRNGVIPADRIQDPFEKNVPGKGLGRDPSRTPMQWDCSPNAGFSSVEPWLPVADDYSVMNVLTEDMNSSSILALYRRLIALRRTHPALAVGTYVGIPATGNVLVYLREAGAERFVIALNLGDQPCTVVVPGFTSGLIVLSTCLDRSHEKLTQSFALRANEGIISTYNDERRY